MNYNTDYRGDGNFFVRKQCAACGKDYYLHACMNASADSGQCPACDKDLEELEHMFGGPEKEKR
jgi:hypothetical protein